MKKYIRYIAGILLAALIFVRLGSILEANYDGNQAMDGFYRLDENTVDVMFYGSSHVYAGVNIVSLWDEYGMAGYDLAGTMQTLWNSYYNMQETLKYQSPKVMVVDVYGALIEEEYYTSTNVIKNVSSMRFSLNKAQNIWSSVPHDEFLTYLLSYPLTHDSYEDLQKSDYVRGSDLIGGKWYKGFKPSFGVTRYDKFPEVRDNIESRPPSDKNREYLERMVDLAKEQQIQLAFIVVPYESWQAEDEEIYTWIEEFAENNNVLFFNGNRKLAEMDFDPAVDYAEGSHLNYNGACKFTEYLGQWLEENCKPEDRRGNELYQSWQEYSECWAEYHKNQDLAQNNDLETYIETIKSDEEYMIFVSVDDNYKNNPFVSVLDQLSAFNPNDFENGGTYVIEAGNLIYRTPDEPVYLWYMETDSSDIAVTRDYGDQMKVLVNNQEQNNNYNDVTIFIYDKKLDMIADVIGYNSDGIIIR